MNYTSSQYRALLQRLKHLHEHDIQSMATSLQGTVGRDLAEIGAGLAALRQQHGTSPKFLADVDHLEATAERAREAIRKLVFALQPPGTDDLGLVPALERTVAEFAETADIRVDLQCLARIPPLSRTRRVVLHHVLLQALENVARHSRARSVEARLTADKHSVFLQVRDDGVGMTDFDRQKVGALGLFALDEGLAECGGSLRIASAQGRGTVLEATVPIARSATKSTAELSLAPSPQDPAEPTGLPRDVARGS